MKSVDIQEIIRQLLYENFKISVPPPLPRRVILELESMYMKLPVKWLKMWNIYQTEQYYKSMRKFQG